MQNIADFLIFSINRPRDLMTSKRVACYTWYGKPSRQFWASHAFSFCEGSIINVKVKLDIKLKQQLT